MTLHRLFHASLPGYNTSMWREPNINDRYYRDDVTSVFEGRVWFYAFCESTMELHRLAMNDDTHDIAVVLKRPRDSQGLTQVFFNKRNSEKYRTWRPKYRPLGLRPLDKWNGARDARNLPVAYVNPYTVSMYSLTAIYNRLSEVPLPNHAFTMYATAARRTIPLLEQSNWVLCTHVPEGSSAMTITPYLHMVRRDTLPAQVREHQRVQVLDLTAVIKVNSNECPHREGTAAARLWKTLRSGMRVLDYCRTLEENYPNGKRGDRQRVRDYLITWAERGVITLG